MKNNRKGIMITLLVVLSLTLIICLTNLSNDSLAYASELENIISSGNATNATYIESYVADAKSARMQHMSSYSDFVSREYFRNGCSFARRLGEGMTVNIVADDNITTIIPKQYFSTAGERMYISEPYGYYIRSESNTGYNEVTVIIFKIEKTMVDYEATIKITTVFSADYYYIISNEASIHYYKTSDGSVYSSETIHINFGDNILNAVIPAISVSTTSLNVIEYYCFAPSKQYELKDISFATRIYNADSLNQCDAGYNVNNDYGYFIIGNRYDYSSTHIVNQSDE